MNVYNRKLLGMMLDQFRARHGRSPERIMMTPLALTVLALRRSVAPKWEGIPVQCQEIDRSALTKSSDARRLGISIDSAAGRSQLVAFDLR